jgi:hypothetical protein
VPPAKRSIPSDAAAKTVTGKMPDIPPRSVDALERENAYLKQRNAQLQEDVTALSAEGERLRQMLERLPGRSSAAGPDGLGRGR